MSAAVAFEVPDDPAALRAVALHHTRRLRLRLVTPELVELFAAAGELDRRLLPRWQPYGDGIHEWAPPGAYSTGVTHRRAAPVRVKGQRGWGWITPREVHTTGRPHRSWIHRDRWLDQLAHAIATTPDALTVTSTTGATRATVAPRTLLAYAKQLSLHAHTSGRRCVVRPKTLAAELGVHVKTVRRCQAILETLGFYVVITPGRMLNEAEKTAAYNAGSYQRGLANDAALVLPHTAPPQAPSSQAGTVDPQPNVPPTRGRYRNLRKLAVVLPFSPQERRAREKEPTSSAPHLRKQGRRYDPAALEVARDLTNHLSWLHSTPAGRLEPMLRRFTRANWSARDLIDAIDALNQTRGHASMTTTEVRNPIGLLAHYLRQLDPADHPHPFAPARPMLSNRRRNTLRVLAQHRGGCGAPNCDHGQINHDDGRVTPCPSCHGHGHQAW